MTDGGPNVDVRATAESGHDLETKPPPPGNHKIAYDRTLPLKPEQQKFSCLILYRWRRPFKINK